VNQKYNVVVTRATTIKGRWSHACISTGQRTINYYIQLAINLINNNEMIENITTKTKVTMKRIN